MYVYISIINKTGKKYIFKRDVFKEYDYIYFQWKYRTTTPSFLKKNRWRDLDSISWYFTGAADAGGLRDDILSQS